MRPSLRFLGIALIGWAGVRAAALGMLPGAGLFRIEPKAVTPPPIVPTQFPAIEPVPLVSENSPYPMPAYPPPSVRPMMIPVYYAAPVSAPVRRSTSIDSLLPRPPSYYSARGSLDDFPNSRFAAAADTRRVSAPRGELPPPPDPPIEQGLDRLQMSTWALLRSQQTGVAGSRSLASGGQLGASQAGARILYNFTRQLAVAVRFSSEVGRRGGEVAGGIRVQPLLSIPVWLTAERRQRIGRYGGGRNDFALFAESGIYGKPLPWRFSLDGYLQGGVVGVKSRDLFVDGGFAATRPVYRNFSAGFGIWGGAQPGLSRLDVGPRLTMQVRRNIKLHADWRQKIVGNARPGSGPTLTLAGDF